MIARGLPEGSLSWVRMRGPPRKAVASSAQGPGHVPALLPSTPGARRAGTRSWEGAACPHAWRLEPRGRFPSSWERTTLSFASFLIYLMSKKINQADSHPGGSEPLPAPHGPLVPPARFIAGLRPEDAAITPAIIFSFLTSLSRWSHLEVLTFK